MRESNVWKQMLLAAGQIRSATVRIFRNNVGQAWAGNAIKVSAQNRHTLRLEVGDVVIRYARPLHAGLMKGSGDGIGWSTITITPDMVGRQMAVFTSAEAKRSKGGRVSEDQQRWHDNVQAAGGISAIVRNPEDLKYAIEEFISHG